MTAKQKIVKEFKFCRYYEDGIEVFGNKEGLPRITAVVPAPDVNHKTEEDRQKTHNEACNGLTLQGYYIVSKRLIRNEAFDKKGQKTTLKLIYRPCKTPEEVMEVRDSIMQILGYRQPEKQQEGERE